MKQLSFSSLLFLLSIPMHGMYSIKRFNSPTKVLLSSRLQSAPNKRSFAFYSNNDSDTLESISKELESLNKNWEKTNSLLEKWAETTQSMYEEQRLQTFALLSSCSIPSSDYYKVLKMMEERLEQKKK
jgi:hypothetical protein